MSQEFVGSLDCGTTYVVTKSSSTLVAHSFCLRSLHRRCGLAPDRISSAGGVYSVTAFSDLLAKHPDPAAAGMLISLTGYTTPAHMARATLGDITIEWVALHVGMCVDRISPLWMSHQ